MADKFSTPTYFFAPRVLVSHPLVQTVTPILDQERLGVFLPLAVAESALRLGPGHQMVFLEIHL